MAWRETGVARAEPQKIGDPQIRHDRDDLSFIASGTAVLIRAEDAPAVGDHIALPLHGEQSGATQPGDTLFTPVGAAHHPEAPSPEDGERP